MGGSLSSEAAAQSSSQGTGSDASSSSDNLEITENDFGPPTHEAIKHQRAATFNQLPALGVRSGFGAQKSGVGINLSRTKRRTNATVTIDGLALASARDPEGQPIRPSRRDRLSSERLSPQASGRASANSIGSLPTSDMSSPDTRSFSRGRLWAPWRRTKSVNEDAWNLGWGGDRGAAPDGLSHPLPMGADGVPDSPTPAQPRRKFTNEGLGKASSSSVPNALLEA